MTGIYFLRFQLNHPFDIINFYFFFLPISQFDSVSFATQIKAIELILFSRCRRTDKRHLHYIRRHNWSLIVWRWVRKIYPPLSLILNEVQKLVEMEKVCLWCWLNLQINLFNNVFLICDSLLYINCVWLQIRFARGIKMEEIERSPWLNSTHMLFHYYLAITCKLHLVWI